MIYELRIYQCVPGRLPALIKRFEDHVENLGKARRPAGRVLDRADRRWQQRSALAWESLAERERVWGTFQADPAWIKVREETEKDGPIIANIESSFLKPTAFSAVR